MRRTRDKVVSGAIWHPSCLFTVVPMAYPSKTLIPCQESLHSSLLALTQHSGRAYIFNRQALGSNKDRHGFDGKARYFTIEISSRLFEAYSRKKMSSANTKKDDAIFGKRNGFEEIISWFDDNFFSPLSTRFHTTGGRRVTEHTT
ncbi:MAG: hypothetical protein A4E63_02663 [Syntrophorhabdus sp. PtaU1.Bin050]|nr:MAG: hypothetical protein A4E63_02663 [Syntrophorhabdus sp. PtaU1.Bin050]